MNCKPGDLACVIRVPPCEPEMTAILSQQLIGKIVRVIALTGSLVPTWQLQEPVALILPAGRVTLHISLMAIADSMLQPIGGGRVHDEQLDEVPA